MRGHKTHCPQGGIPERGTHLWADWTSQKSDPSGRWQRKIYRPGARFLVPWVDLFLAKHTSPESWWWWVIKEEPSKPKCSCYLALFLICQGKGNLRDKGKPESFYNHVCSGLALSNSMSPLQSPEPEEAHLGALGSRRRGGGWLSPMVLMRITQWEAAWCCRTWVVL